MTRMTGSMNLLTLAISFLALFFIGLIICIVSYDVILQVRDSINPLNPYSASFEKSIGDLMDVFLNITRSPNSFITSFVIAVLGLMSGGIIIRKK